MKLSPLSLDILSSRTVHNTLDVSPSSPIFPRYFQADTTPERQAGKEITSILLKKSRPDLLKCAAPLPSRVRAAALNNTPSSGSETTAAGEEEDDEMFLFTHTSPKSLNPEVPVMHNNRWYTESPTLLPLSCSSPCCSDPLPSISKAEMYLPSISGITNRTTRTTCRPRPSRGRFLEHSTPTTIVGTPPCRSYNPLVNDTQFLQSKPKETLCENAISAIGSELGLFRLSPATF